MHDTGGNLQAGEALLHLISERHPLLAAHADDARLLLLLTELEKARRLRLRWPSSQPPVEPLHRHLAIPHRRAAFRADVMPHPLHVTRVLEA